MLYDLSKNKMLMLQAQCLVRAAQSSRLQMIEAVLLHGGDVNALRHWGQVRLTHTSHITCPAHATTISTCMWPGPVYLVFACLQL